MTTEEKAKKYDEALEWMRKLYPGLHGATKEDAEHYFPELKESEDERIRKVLVDMVNRETGFTGFPSQGQVLAYLEKQKEPDGTWTEEDDAKVKVMCKEGDLKPSERAWLKELKNRIVKEQKSEEFNEYKIIKKHITEDSLSSEVNKRLTECGWYVTDEKPEEWSKEDEYRRKDAIYFLETARKHYADTSEIELTIDWLKSLKPQPKQDWMKEQKNKSM